jgi:hypothetical protein
MQIRGEGGVRKFAVFAYPTPIVEITSIVLCVEGEGGGRFNFRIFCVRTKCGVHVFTIFKLS